MGARLRMRTGTAGPHWRPLHLRSVGSTMASAVSLPGVLGLLLVSALPEVLGVLPSPELRAHPGDPTQVGPAFSEPRRRQPLKDQHERARTGALPLGALYTAALVAFVLYKCLQQGKDEATVLQEETNKKESLQSEQQLAQLTQQLAQTEQHLNNLMAQLDPLFERVTTLAGAQQELLSIKLQTIHQLLQDNKPDKGVEVLEPECSSPFPEALCIEEAKEAANSQTWEEPLNWSTETRNQAPPWEVEQGLRRRCSRTMAKGPRHRPCWKGGTTAESLVKQSLFL
ncbi:Coiled-coil domain-containing protein 107 [Galemys pyrenaicus]|uniref:Coiled-coil domain-containing protein 107 n=1 Tax=Galemys pyrenaicus TaxID=202257 RepID=A0A8J5ZJ00_GALPY|nr:Coiled-coil domain-containing protein 107 [Galemys pyrenaicus]